MNRFNTAVLCLLLSAGSCKPTPSTGSEPEVEIVGTEATFISNFRLIPGDGSLPIEYAEVLYVSARFTLTLDLRREMA